MGSFLFTGATGLVGRYLVRELLEAGISLAVVVRPNKMETASERIDAIMRHWEREAGYALPRPVVLEGDLCSPGLGLAERDRRWIADHCDAVIHCGASMVFREDQHGEPFRTNVGGVENLLAVCREAHIDRFHHVSTAYVCGLREGRVLESELDLGQTLGNVYEQSKLRCEQLVRQADFLQQTTIYRPGSVVGDSRTGYVTSAHGFYLPLQLAHLVADKVPVREMNTRFMSLLGLQGNEGKNLVPVDWLARAIAAILVDRQLHGQTYHLASEHPVAVSAIQQVIQDAIEAYHPSARRVAGGDHLSAYESLFQEYMSVYQSHWRDDPQFDLTNTRHALPRMPCPELDYDTLMRIARYPIEKKFNLTKFEKTDFDFNVGKHFSSLVQPHATRTATERIDFQVNGSGGGHWQVAFAGDEVCGVEPGPASRHAAHCYLTTSALRSLVRKQLSVKQSVEMGRVVLESNGLGNERLVALLEKIAATN